VNAAADLFERIVCGVDGTPESAFAVRQAVRLSGTGATLVLVAVADVAAAAQAGMAAAHAAGLLEQEAEAALAEAAALAPSADARVLAGRPPEALLDLLRSEHASLVVVGSHGRRRAAGMLLGTVATRMLHEAPCSVLISRPARDPATWPQAIVAGVDGSPESELAVAAARSLASSRDADLRIVSATTDEVHREAARKLAPELEERDGRAVGVLTNESETADLVVVGSRGLQGFKALGSVSERIAHQAGCSVLVVRATAG
jgi:nucleotide-binding universal stress UspA family protein